MSTETVDQRVAAAVRALHQPDRRRECGARATMTVQHSRGATSERRLYCTEDAAHDGDHRDALCCWRFHKFPDAVVDAYEPRDLRRCITCNDSWPCTTARAIQTAEEGTL